MEVFNGRNRSVLADEFKGVILDYSVEYEGVGQAAVRLASYLEVRGDSAPVPDGPTLQGLEFMGEGVRNMADGAVFVTVAVIDCLDAASGGGIVLCGRDFKLPVIGQVADTLDKSLSVGPGTDNGASVEVLDGSGDDFRGRSGR